MNNIEKIKQIKFNRSRPDIEYIEKVFHSERLDFEFYDENDKDFDYDDCEIIYFVEIDDFIMVKPDYFDFYLGDKFVKYLLEINPKYFDNQSNIDFIVDKVSNIFCFDNVNDIYNFVPKHNKILKKIKKLK